LISQLSANPLAATPTAIYQYTSLVIEPGKFNSIALTFRQKLNLKLYIKNMVCSRCKMAVKNEFEKTGIYPVSVELGEVELTEQPTKAILQQLDVSLNNLGFEIIDDRKSRLIEKIKNTIVELIHHNEDNLNVNLSQYISQTLNYDYNYLSNLFSEVEGLTIEKYLIAQKIEKVKELLKYDELTLSQIADKLGYSSVAYLSNQFKKQTGLSPTFYKTLKQNIRKNLDDL
jgi:YesN/AraC family two-component response regulator